MSCCSLKEAPEGISRRNLGSFARKKEEKGEPVTNVKAFSSLSNQSFAADTKKAWSNMGKKLGHYNKKSLMLLFFFFSLDLIDSTSSNCGKRGGKKDHEDDDDDGIAFFFPWVQIERRRKEEELLFGTNPSKVKHFLRIFLLLLPLLSPFSTVVYKKGGAFSCCIKKMKREKSFLLFFSLSFCSLLSPLRLEMAVLSQQIWQETFLLLFLLFSPQLSIQEKKKELLLPILFFSTAERKKILGGHQKQDLAKSKRKNERTLSNATLCFFVLPSCWGREKKKLQGIGIPKGF